MYGYINAGMVCYGKDEASVEIGELIEALEEAREDGVTHIVGLSGNYRGAQWTRLTSNVTYGLDDEDEDW